MDTFAHSLFADAGPGPLIYPILGCMAIAGLFFAIGIVLGGFWLFKRATSNDPSNTEE